MNIQGLREARQLTQCELANLIGVSQSAVSQWESGIILPSTTVLIKLSKVLDCTVDELLYEKVNINGN